MELVEDIDRKFLLEGIQDGFRISDIEDTGAIEPVCADNHPSVNKNYELVQRELQQQLEAGNYKLADKDFQPKIISPLGAIPKDNNDVRVIHDCSRPTGKALNDYCQNSSVQYQNINDAYGLASTNVYMSKVDLKASYRSVAIHPIHQIMC